MRVICVLGLFASMVSASTVTQTSWYDAYMHGPVSDWYGFFWISDNITVPSEELKLEQSPLENTVDGEFDGAWSVYAADVDGDGDADILGAAYTDNDITWWENSDGTGTSWIEHTVDGEFGGAESVFSIDLDDDGDADVLGAAISDNDITWWENADGTGTSWTEHTVDGEFGGARSVFAIDVDDDGDTDVLGAAFSDNDIAWWENMNGSGTSWTEHTVDGNFGGALSVFATDVNGDGYMDVLGAAYSDNDISWWENTDGTGTSWIEHVVDVNFGGATTVFATDVDGDGDVDVLSTSSSWSSISWWENTDGAGTSWTEHTVTTLNGGSSVYASDLDGDGDTDVLGASSWDSAINWWENTDGTGTSWTEHTVDGEFGGARCVFATDVDGDGVMDVLGAAYDGDDIAWWKLYCYSSTGFLESSILDVETGDSWDLFESNQLLPPETSLGFQFRSSQDYNTMGVWSDTVFSSSTPLSGILADSTRYLQYRVILETSDPSVSPELYDVTFSYDLLVGTEESESGEVPSWSLHALENPSHGLFSALISVPETGTVELSIYDVSGRVVGNVSQEFVSGTHSVNFTGLSEGVYFCTMQAEGFASTERVVVLK